MDRYNEYRYRRLFQCSHEEYLDTPYEDIEWMLHLDRTVESAKNPGSRPVSAPEPMVPPTPYIG